MSFSTQCCRESSIAPKSLVTNKLADSGQATVEFALTLPFLVLFSLCVVQISSVANDQLVVNHAAQTAARAISLADITPETAQEVAIMTLEREITLQDVQIEATLDDESARVEVNYQRDLAMPVIGKLLGRVSLHATATMPRQVSSIND